MEIIKYDRKVCQIVNFTLEFQSEGSLVIGTVYRYLYSGINCAGIAKLKKIVRVL